MVRPEDIDDELVRFTPAMRLEPSLAAGREEASPTRRRLHLREGVRFSDDDPLAMLVRTLRQGRSPLGHHATE